MVKRWHQGRWWVWLLSPLTVIFWLLSGLRRASFKVGLKKSVRVDAKVIVVGNISVGGNGKTPVVLALAEYYKKRGLTVGILSRGYGGKSAHYPRVVTKTDNPLEVGDEPKLLAVRSDVTVVIDPVRSRGARYLSNECHCDLIICDDGLQHYALARDVEIVVMDERMLGSGYLMPMGPLREGRWRLSKVDALIHNRHASDAPTLNAGKTQQYIMRLSPGRFTSVCEPDKTIGFDKLANIPTTAIAGIGAPERFFGQLKQMGMQLSHCHGFPDHHQFTAKDIPAGTVLMTEKDAVKVADFAHDNCWYLPVSANIDSKFYTLIDQKLAEAGLTVTPTEKRKNNGI
nr:tetraacyldisaccharide 4'-kinase [Alteromonas profundi]